MSRERNNIIWFSRLPSAFLLLSSFICPSFSFFVAGSSEHVRFGEGWQGAKAGGCKRNSQVVEIFPVSSPPYVRCFSGISGKDLLDPVRNAHSRDPSWASGESRILADVDPPSTVAVALSFPISQWSSADGGRGGTIQCSLIQSLRMSRTRTPRKMSVALTRMPINQMWIIWASPARCAFIMTLPQPDTYLFKDCSNSNTAEAGKIFEDYGMWKWWGWTNDNGYWSNWGRGGVRKDGKPACPFLARATKSGCGHQGGQLHSFKL